MDGKEMYSSSSTLEADRSTTASTIASMNSMYMARGNSRLPIYSGRRSNCWKMRTVLERSMLLLICLLVTFLVALSVLIATNLKLKSEKGFLNGFNQGRFHESINDCTNAACFSQSVAMLSVMNTSVDPCQDFYQFACGRKDRSSLLDILTKNVDEGFNLDLQKILEQPVESLGSKAEKLAQLYYQSCLQTSTQSLNPGRYLQKQMLDRIGGWWALEEISNRSIHESTGISFQQVFQQVHNFLNVDAFFHWGVQLAPTKKGDLTNPERHTIRLYHSGLTLKNISNYFINDNTEVMFKNLVIEVMANLWPDIPVSAFRSTSFESTMRDIFEVESRIAKVTPLVEMRHQVGSYEYVTIAELNTIAPFIDWNNFFQSAFSEENITITPSHTVLVSSTAFLRGVSTLVSELIGTNGRKLMNYLCWHTTYHHYQILKKSYWKNTKRSTDIQKDCTADTAYMMPFAVSAMRIRKRFDSESSRALAESMIKSIKESFKENLNNLDWLGDDAHLLLRNKVEALSSLMGYSEFMLNSTMLDKFYSGLEIFPSDYFVNNANLEFYLFRKELKKFDQTTDETWVISPNEVISSYSRNLDLIGWPSGIMYQPVFDATFPHALHFGSIGASFGYELERTRFENSSLLLLDRSKNSKSRQLSMITKIQNFEKSSKCLIQQYSNYTSNVHTVGEKLTLDEIIADSGGLKAAYDAFSNWNNTHEEILLGLTHKQMFFLSFAQSWCRNSQAEEVTKLKVHSPTQYRVVGTLSNMPEFSTAFQCAPGSLMNPKEKCAIW